MEVKASVSTTLFATDAPSNPNYRSPYLLLPYASSFPVFKNKIGIYWLHNKTLS